MGEGNALMIEKFEPGPFYVAVHQPNFMPWIGFWNKLVNADRMVLMCGVQFDRGDYQHRVKLNGSWLTVPVKSTQHHAMITEIEMADTSAIPRLAKTVRQVVMSKKNKYRDRLGDLVTMLETWPADRPSIAGLNIRIIREIANVLQCHTVVDVDIKIRDGSKVEKLDALIMDKWPLHCAPPIYLSGHAALDYMNHNSLKFPTETRFQLPNEGLSSDSVVQLIAQHEDPLSVIRSCAKWLTKDGIVDDAETGLSSSTTC
jgi:hypothetical protein